MECDVKMNKKLMLFGVFLAASIMFLMPCINAVNLESINITQESIMTSNNVDEVEYNIGTVEIYGGIGDHVIITGSPDKTFDLGRDGGNIKIKATIKFDVWGLGNEGYAAIKNYWSWDTYADDSEEGTRTVTLEHTFENLKEGDCIFLKLYGKYTDVFIEEDDWVSVRVSVKKHPNKSKLMITGYETAPADPNEDVTAEFRVNNIAPGGSPSTLHWKICEFGGAFFDSDNGYNDWEINVQEGENGYLDGGTLVKLKWTIPADFEKGETINGYLKFENLDYPYDGVSPHYVKANFRFKRHQGESKINILDFSQFSNIFRLLNLNFFNLK